MLIGSGVSWLQISLDLNASEKFGCLLRSALVVLSQLLEAASIQEVGKHADELLTYLRSTMSREPTCTVNCVQQVRAWVGRCVRACCWCCQAVVIGDDVSSKKSA